MRLRQTKKYRELLVALRGRFGTSALRKLIEAHPGLLAVAKAAPTHDEAYWVAVRAGLAYDSAAGWYVVDEPPARGGDPLDVRLEGPHAALVAAEVAIRNAGFHVLERSGPRAGRGGVFLSYLSVQLPR